MVDLPKDKMMLLSFVNTQLRDNYDNLDEFCRAYDTEVDYIKESLLAIDYEYDESLNKFV